MTKLDDRLPILEDATGILVIGSPNVTQPGGGTGAPTDPTLRRDIDLNTQHITENRQIITITSDNTDAAVLRIDELEARWNDFLGGTVAPYDSGSTYSTGAVVRHSGKIWAARKDSLLGVEPGTDATAWTDISHPSLVVDFRTIEGEIGDVHKLTAGSLVDHIAGLEARLLKLEQAGGSQPTNPTSAFGSDSQPVLVDPAYSGNFVAIRLDQAQIVNVVDNPFDASDHIWFVKGYSAGKGEGDISANDGDPIWVVATDPQSGQTSGDLKKISVASSGREVTVAALKTWAAGEGTFLTVKRDSDAWSITAVQPHSGPSA